LEYLGLLTTGVQLEILKTNNAVSKIMVNSSSQTFTCEMCNTVFDSREQLREHSINKHEGKKRTSTRDELTFSCEACNTTFTSREDLRQHSIEQHEGRQ
jgi:5-methylcytosine-specific restriction endonuclease McrA